MVLALVAGACSRKTTNTDSDSSVVMGYKTEKDLNGKPTTLPMKEKVRVMDVPKVNQLPPATAFRMNGEYQDNVAITINPEGVLIYFPDPKDITADSRPIELGDGWWLNCQGLSPNSVFTKYTFPEYAELPAVPTVQQLKNSVIPGSGVTQFIELPYTISQAAEHIPEIKEYLKDK